MVSLAMEVLLDRSSSTVGNLPPTRLGFNVLMLPFSVVFPDRVGRFVIDGIVNPTLYAGGPSYKLWPCEYSRVV